MGEPSEDDELAARLATLCNRGHRAVIAGTIRGDTCSWAGGSAGDVSPDLATIFEIGSITKALTGVLLAEMVVRGEVDLGDPLSAHLPGPGPAWRYREPTLLELATHRSGLPNTPGPMHSAELRHAAGLLRGSPWASVDRTDYRRLVAAQSPRRPPGARSRYSSVAVGLLGDASAARAGISYEQLLTERLLGPLEMLNTTVTVPTSSAHRLLGGHSRRGHPRPPLDDLMPAAGSLRSPVADMLRFLAACLSPPPGTLGDALILARQPRARMGGGVDVGLCWMSIDTPDRGRMVWHNGGTWGFRSFAGFAPDRGSAAVVLSNTARSVDRLGLQLAW